MKNSKTSLLAAALILTVIGSAPTLISYAANPTANPPTANVDATFNTVTAGNGMTIKNGGMTTWNTAPGPALRVMDPALGAVSFSVAPNGDLSDGNGPVFVNDAQGMEITATDAAKGLIVNNDAGGIWVKSTGGGLTVTSQSGGLTVDTGAAGTGGMNITSLNGIANDVTKLIPPRAQDNAPVNITDKDGLAIKGAPPVNANNGQLTITETTGSNAMILGRTTDYGFVQSHAGDPLALNPIGNNVGIGLTNPADKLHVANSIRIGNDTTYPSVYGQIKHDGSSNGFILNANAGGGGWADMLFQTNGTTKMFLESGGNFGIGTTSPTANLHVEPSAGEPAMVVGRDTGYPNIKASSGQYLIMDSSGNYTSINHYVADNVNLVNGGGNVGIGTVTPSYKLDVAGAINGSSWIQAGASLYASSNIYTYGTSSYNYFAGNVGIGMAPSYKLDVSGSARASYLYADNSITATYGNVTAYNGYVRANTIGYFYHSGWGNVLSLAPGQKGNASKSCGSGDIATGCMAYSVNNALADTDPQVAAVTKMWVGWSNDPTCTVGFKNFDTAISINVQAGAICFSPNGP